MIFHVIFLSIRMPRYFILVTCTIFSHLQFTRSKQLLWYLSWLSKLNPTGTKFSIFVFEAFLTIAFLLYSTRTSFSTRPSRGNALFNCYPTSRRVYECNIICKCDYLTSKCFQQKTIDENIKETCRENGALRNTWIIYQCYVT